MCKSCGCSTSYGSPKIKRHVDCEVANIIESVYGEQLDNASVGDVQTIDGAGNPAWLPHACPFFEFYDYSLTGGNLIDENGNVSIVGELRFSLPPALGVVNGFALCSLSLADNTSVQDSRFIAWNTNIYPIAAGTPRAFQVDLSIDGKLEIAHLILPVINSDILFRVDGLDGADPLDVDYSLKVYMLKTS